MLWYWYGKTLNTVPNLLPCWSELTWEIRLTGGISYILYICYICPFCSLSACKCLINFTPNMLCVIKTRIRYVYLNAHNQNMIWSVSISPNITKTHPWGISISCLCIPVAFCEQWYCPNAQCRGYIAAVKKVTGGNVNNPQNLPGVCLGCQTFPVGWFGVVNLA